MDTPAPTRRPSAQLRWAMVFFFAFALMVFDPVAGLIYSASAPADLPLPDPATTPSPMLELQARHALGIEKLFNESIADTPFAPGPDDYRNIAGDDLIDRARLVPMLAELFGPEPALAELDSIRADEGDELDEGIAQDLSTFESIINAQPVTEDQRARIIDRHGFFGELAVAQIQGDAQAQAIRDTITDSASSFTLRLVGFGLVIVLAVAIGFVALVATGILFATGALKPSFSRNLRETPSHEHNWLMAETVALFLGAFFAFKLLGTLAAKHVPEDAILIGQFALAGLIFWPAVRLGSVRKAGALLGWTKGRGLFTEIGLGIFTYFAGLPIVALGLLTALVLISVFGGMPSHPVTESIPTGGLVEIILLYVLACVWAPIVEETIFRGAFYRAVRVHIPGAAGIALAFALTSFVFAAIHPQGILFVPPLMALAVVFAFMREWRSSIVPCMFTHAMHNATIVTFIIILFGV